MNKSRPGAPPFYWQEEYGAFTFDGKRLPNVIAYVENQKQHHAQHSTIPILERTEGEEVRLIKEATVSYFVEEARWCEEMLLLNKATNSLLMRPRAAASLHMGLPLFILGINQRASILVPSAERKAIHDVYLSH